MVPAQGRRRGRIVVALVFAALLAAFLYHSMRPALKTQSASLMGTPRAPTASTPHRVVPPSAPVPDASRVSISAPDESLVLPPEAHPSFARFVDWSARFLAAEAGARSALMAEGKTLAAERHDAMKVLIRCNPETAWSHAVSPSVRQQLPEEIQSQLEQRISARGDILSVVATNFDGPRPQVQRSHSVVIGQAVYEAHLYGRRKEQRTVRNTPLHGIALDNIMAVHADTARLLDPSEYTPEMLTAAKDARCPISGKLIAPESLAVASVGARAVYLCHSGHIVELAEAENAAEDEQIAQEGGNGGGQKPSGFTSTPIADGPKTLLYIRLVFPDAASDPQSEESCYNMLRDMNDFWVANSHGRTYVIPTVTPPVMMPRTAAWYFANDGSSAFTLRSDALDAARKMGYDYNSYDLEAIRYNGASGGFGGQAYVGSRGCWLKSSSTGVAAHEFGHNVGLWHANYWDVNPDTSPIGPGSHVEYGHSFDTMGAASAGNNFFNSQHQNIINWLPTEFVALAATSGTYRIYQLDQARLENGRAYALKVRKDAIRDYWGEFRQRFTSNNWMSNGLLMHWSPWYLSAGGAHLLDTTPGTPTGNSSRDDAALVLGRTFSDAGAGIHITPVSKNGTAPESLDVVVNLGKFPGNSAPNFSGLSASSMTPAVGAAVNFTATATDPNGDNLAYYWDFGDGLLGGNTVNSATPSRSFATAGHYNVICTVTDMKGGTATRSILITVGTPTTFRISGQVTDGASPLRNALVKAGNFTTYTDASGNYTLGRLNAATHAVSVLLDGYTFTGQSITVGPDQSGVNFVGTALPVVSLSVPDATITEVGENPGTVRFTRTGPTTAALTVRFNFYKDSSLIGSNPLTSDTDFRAVSPAPTYDSASRSYAVDIPAGSASLDWVVTPADDTAQEGTEALRVVIYPNAAYVPDVASEAVLEILDSDSSKGKVYIAAEDVYGSETGANTAAFRVFRVGPTASALTVNFSDSGGTATSGSDYTSLGTSVTLNAGEASKLIIVTPTNDAAAEGTESVRVSLSSSTAYDIDFTRSNATVFIQDDDINVLTLTTADASAAEELQDPGVFVVSRTGSTTQALTVNYSISGTALNGNDYFNLPGAVTIPAGQATAAITVIPYDDTIGEPSQTVIVTLESDAKFQLSAAYTGTVTILDDDDAPYITVNASDATGTEGGSDNGQFTLFRPKTGAATTVNYTITGSAAAGTDYTALSGSVTFSTSETSKTISVAVLDDAVLENTETVVLTLQPGAGYVVNDDEAVATVYINDNEKPVVTVAVGFGTVTETSANVSFYFRRSNTTGALTVNYTLGGTATNGSDYATVPLSVTIADGQNSATVAIDPTDDSVVEGTETVVLSISDSADYSVGVPSTATMYIADSESPTLSLQFAATTSNGSEGTATVNVPVNLSAASGSTVMVEYAMGFGCSAFPGNDFVLVPGVLTFAPGQTSRNISFTVLEDTQIEGAETVVINLLNPNGARLTGTQHTYTINDNDSYGAARIGFASATQAVAEDVGIVGVQVALSTALASSASVNYAVTGGTATGGGVDFTLASGTLTFAAGETLKTINLPIVNDTAGESTETIVIGFSSPSNAQIAGNTTYTLSINDDDTPNTPPTISNVTDRTINEDSNTGAIAITVGDAETAVTALVMSGSSSNTTLVPNANIVFGGSGANRTVTVTPAANQSGTATITLTVADGQGGSTSDTFVLTVTAVNDLPTISNVTDRTINEDTNTGAIAFTVGDVETAVASLVMSGTSSNTTLVPNANIIFGGSGANRTVTVTPAANQSGTATITLTVTDANSGVATDTFVLTVTALNDLPTISNITDRTINEDTNTGAIAFAVGDVETAVGSLTLSGSSSNTTLVPNANIVFGGSGANRTVTVTPVAQQSGTATITITVTDANSGTATDTFVLTVTAVNDLPTITDVTNKTTNEDVASGPHAFTVGDVETAVGSLTLAGSSSNTALVPNANITFGGSGANRTVTVTPAANQNGTATITLTVTDGNGGTGTDTFVLTVTAVNDPPTISNITNKAVPPSTVAGPYAFTVGDVETAAGSLTVTATSSNTTLLPNASIALGGSGANRTITLTPAAAQTGTTTITVTVSDGTASATDSFSLNVDPSNAPPTIAAAAGVSPQPVITATATLSALGADNDGEAGLTYTWALGGTPPASVVYSENGTNAAKSTQVTFTAPGSYDFTVTITDVGGLSVTSSVTANVVATLTVIDVTPSAVDVAVLATQTFGASGRDQFGQPFTLGTVGWTVSGGGTIDAIGFFTAATTPGAFIVSASSGSVTGTGTLNVVAGPGPQLSSGVTVTPNPSVVGQTVAFIAAASGLEPLTFAWDFGDGSTGGGSGALHVYAAAGAYSVSVTVTDANGGTATASSVAIVEAGGGANPPDVDTDGDGVSDVNEIGDGSDPADPSSFVISPLTVTKLRLSVRFDQTSKDGIQFSGVFPSIPSSFSPSGSTFVIDVGGAKGSLTLDAKGRGKSANASVGLKLKFIRDKATKKVSFVGGNVPFKGTLKLGTWADDWADEGLNGASDAKKAAMSVPVLIAFNGRMYGTAVNGLYTAKAGKSGKFQK